MKNGDIVFGTMGTVGTITLTQFNTGMACAAGLLTVGVMLLRFRKEWRDRNK